MLLLLLSLLLVLSMSMSAIGFAAILQYNDITKAPGIGQGWRGFHDFNHISFELDASLASTVCTPFHESITWPCSCSSGDFSLSCFFAFSLLCFFFFASLHTPKEFPRRGNRCVAAVASSYQKCIFYSRFNLTVSRHSIRIQIPCAAFRFSRILGFLGAENAVENCQRRWIYVPIPSWTLNHRLWTRGSRISPCSCRCLADCCPRIPGYFSRSQSLPLRRRINSVTRPRFSIFETHVRKEQLAKRRDQSKS